MPGPIELMTNFFEVKCMDTQVDWTLYQVILNNLYSQLVSLKNQLFNLLNFNSKYHVNFEPDIQSKVLKSGLLKEHNAIFKNSRAFDGSTIYSMTKLPDAV